MSTPRTPVVFDLDGTLVDSEPNYYEAARRLLGSHGVGDFTWERHTEFIGIGTRETADDPAFRTADRLFRGGQSEFTAEAHSTGFAADDRRTLTSGLPRRSTPGGVPGVGVA